MWRASSAGATNGHIFGYGRSILHPAVAPPCMSTTRTDPSHEGEALLRRGDFHKKSRPGKTPPPRPCGLPDSHIVHQLRPPPQPSPHGVPTGEGRGGGSGPAIRCLTIPTEMYELWQALLGKGRWCGSGRALMGERGRRGQGRLEKVVQRVFEGQLIIGSYIVGTGRQGGAFLKRGLNRR